MAAADICFGARRLVGPGWPTLVVAEIGQNHNGRLALAEQLIDAAAWAGADAVKFVKRDLDWELSAAAREQPYTSPHAYGATYGEHRQALELSAEEHATLRARAASHGLLCLITASDPPSLDLALQLEVDGLKIASRDLANTPLVERIARAGRPVILSTGMSSWNEIDVAVGQLRGAEATFALLHCTSLYPTPPGEVHLRSMISLATRYDALVGFSDHTIGWLLPPLAVALGAVVIEKHFTLDRRMKGTDHACSLEPDELRQMIADLRQAEVALGRSDKPISPEIGAVRAKLGRSLATRHALPAGALLDESAFVMKSPGDGLGWSERSHLVGRRVARHIPADTTLTWDDVI
ncbi:MAG: N-acetylneuraminate synthase family protein [Pirellulales bacterium]|nr:N-acetylneuraminate synthase family protein [Pirellulales bacterium]